MSKSELFGISGAYVAPECKAVAVELSSVLASSVGLELGPGPDLEIGDEYNF
ncbi:MAG: hypothetical protein IJ222_09150 [Bacteroidales bacterium]|nr:hypothetical protein [Bacteroidales bacterium]